MKDLAIILAILFLVPFYVFFLSKLQMLGWIAGLKFHLIYEKEQDNNGETNEEK